MDYEARPLNDDSDAAVRAREAKAANGDKLDVTVELTVNGQSLYRRFHTYNVSHIDWNPIVADMADTIEKARGL